MEVINGPVFTIRALLHACRHLYPHHHHTHTFTPFPSSPLSPSLLLHYISTPVFVYCGFRCFLYYIRGITRMVCVGRGRRTNNTSKAPEALPSSSRGIIPAAESSGPTPQGSRGPSCLPTTGFCFHYPAGVIAFLNMTEKNSRRV